MFFLSASSQMVDGQQNPAGHAYSWTEWCRYHPHRAIPPWDVNPRSQRRLSALANPIVMSLIYILLVLFYSIDPYFCLFIFNNVCNIYIYILNNFLFFSFFDKYFYATSTSAQSMNSIIGS
jgi:hypothetical protein